MVASLQAEQQIIAFAVEPIQEFVLYNSPSSFVVSGINDSCQIDCLYALTTNQEQKKIIGFLENPLPEGMTMTVCVQAPRGAKSVGPVILSLQPQILVQNISKVAQENLTISYTISSKDPVSCGSYQQFVQISLVD